MDNCASRADIRNSPLSPHPRKLTIGQQVLATYIGGVACVTMGTMNSWEKSGVEISKLMYPTGGIKD